MPKYWPFILALVVVLAAVSLFGYLRPRPEPELPVKILFAPPNAEAVVFTHAAHADTYNVDCASCHHEYPGDRPDPQACRNCHGAAFDEEFKTGHIQAFGQDASACVTCHHLEPGVDRWTREMHDEHAASYASDCTDCHHGPEIEPEPQSCKNCHATLDKGKMPAPDKDMPTYRDAAHARCANCHSDWIDAGIAGGCSSCHDFASTRPLAAAKNLPDTLTDCVACHYQQDMGPQDLMLTAEQAFHGSCMGCHERLGKGPHQMPKDLIRTKKDESRHCAQCHTG